MANEISKLITPDGVSHDIKDSVARQASYDVSNKVDKTGDSMTGSLDLLGSELHLKTASSSSNDSGDIVWFYGNGQEKARIWADDNPTSLADGKLNVKAYKSDGTQLFTGKLATMADIPDVSLRVSKYGDTMLGELKTSFLNCVVGGARESTKNNIPDLCNELRFSSGCCGSVSITTAYTKDGVTIPSSWYNYLYIPHRSGGVNGSASGDNCSYGTLMLSNMTGDTQPYFIRIKSSSDYVAHVYKLAASSDIPDISTKLSKAGDTATGKITFNQGIAIKAGSGSNRPPCFISLLQSFADGGAIGYTNQSDMQYAIGVNGDDNHAASTGAALSSDTGKLGLHWYSQTGKIAQQPTQYGFLLTCANSKGSVEQHSIFMEQPNGSLYHMGTNASSSGSPPAYKKIWDSGNLNPQSALSSYGVTFTKNHGNITNWEYTCTRYGNVIQVNGYFKTNATIAANQVLFSSLPGPYGSLPLYFILGKEGTDTACVFKIELNGQLKTNQQIGAGTYIGQMTYICKN